MIHGWRPTSVTNHPASIAMRPRGPATTSARRNLGSSGNPRRHQSHAPQAAKPSMANPAPTIRSKAQRSEEHTSELQSHSDLVCRLLLEKKKKNKTTITNPRQVNARI